MPSRWADQPYSLIATEAFSKDVHTAPDTTAKAMHADEKFQTSHGAYYAATQMALAHNGIIRGLNSIYLQAAALPSDDTTAVRDFLTYCQCWCESMHHHHDVEEETFFPAIERVSDQPGLMQQNVDQHAAFTPGFVAFNDYVESCAPQDYDGQEIKRLIEAFAEPLRQHLGDEINSLRALDKYDSVEVRKAYDQMDRLMRVTDNQRIAPLVFGTADKTFEGGRHDFPAVPFFVPYIIHYVFERRHRGAWRFNPSTSWREPRELAFKPEDAAGRATT